MLITIRNLFVRIIAFFISEKEARHKFRNKYEKKTKFRKLRDDNKRLFEENESLRLQLADIRTQHIDLKIGVDQINNFIRYFTLSERYIKPIDDTATQDYPQVYLSIVCIAKNEGQYLKEWIEYHKLIGVERFYFYDNGSTDNTKEILDPYIKDRAVVYKYIEGRGLQDKVYADAAFRYSSQTKWLAVIDLDEFIVPKEQDDLREFLGQYESYPGLSINWVCFDSSGHEKKPTAHGGLVTANYTRVRKDYNHLMNREIKTIHDAASITLISHHFAFYTNFGLAVDENFKWVDWGPYSKEHTSSKIQVNHYMTKSREEFLSKVNRGRAFSYGKHDFSRYEINFSGETTEDLAIQRFLPKLMKAMGIAD